MTKGTVWLSEQKKLNDQNPAPPQWQKALFGCQNKRSWMTKILHHLNDKRHCLVVRTKEVEWPKSCTTSMTKGTVWLSEQKKLNDQNPAPPQWQKALFGCQNKRSWMTKILHHLNDKRHCLVVRTKEVEWPKSCTTSMTKGTVWLSEQKKLNDQNPAPPQWQKTPNIELGGKGDALICPSSISKCWCRISPINRTLDIL